MPKVKKSKSRKARRIIVSGPPHLMNNELPCNDADLATQMTNSERPGSSCSPPPPLLEANVTCQICQKSFTTAHSLKTHVNSHTRETVFPCPKCGRTFLRKVYVTAHLKVHEREEQMPVHEFPCTGIECRQSFTSQKLLDAHQRKHTHECPFCQKSATSRRFLNYHIMKHTGEFPEQCRMCKKWYTSAKILISHKCKKVEDKNKD